MRRGKTAGKRAERQELHRELEQARATIAGEAPRPTVGAPSRGSRSGRLRDRLSHGSLATLAEAGITVGEYGAVSADGRPVGQLREAWPAAGAPLRLQALVGLALDRPRSLRSPTWLALVRMMPCSFCPAVLLLDGDERPHTPFRAQLTLARSQSEAHHYPPRGRAAGGSDLETCPACSACHRACTAGQISELRQAAAVERTTREIFAGIREGWLQSGLLLAVAVEVVL